MNTTTDEVPMVAALPEPDAAIKEVMGLVKEMQVMANGHGIRTGGISTTSDQSIKGSSNLLRELEVSIEYKLRALLATGGQAQAGKELQLALQEAYNLAQSIFTSHYSVHEYYANGSVVWELCGDLRGVLSQISNMVSGLVRNQQTS